MFAILGLDASKDSVYFMIEVIKHDCRALIRLKSFPGIHHQPVVGLFGCKGAHADPGLKRINIIITRQADNTGEDMMSHISGWPIAPARHFDRITIPDWKFQRETLFGQVQAAGDPRYTEFTRKVGGDKSEEVDGMHTDGEQKEGQASCTGH